MMTIKEIVDQLKLCKFKDEHGHPIENNIAFTELERLASLEKVTIKVDTELDEEQIEEFKRLLDQPGYRGLITTPMDIEYTESEENVFWGDNCCKPLLFKKEEE